MPALLMALQALCLLAIISVLWLAPGLNFHAFLHQVGEALVVLLLTASATIGLKGSQPVGHSPLLAASSILFVLGGPSVFAAAASLALDPPELQKINFCAALVYLVGCLFYWVSCGDEEELLRPV